MHKKSLSWILTLVMMLSLFTAIPLTASAVDDISPYATGVSVDGDAIAGQTLTGVYTYNSESGNPESGTTFRWLKSNDSTELFTNYTYTADLYSGPTEDTVFTLSEDTYINGIKTYHVWDDNEPGTIELRDQDGTVYGPWQAVRAESYTTYYWLAKPEIVLPAGTYTVIDSRPTTWTYNTPSAGQGHTWVYGGGFTEISGDIEISYTTSENDYQDVICFEVTARDSLGNTGDPVRAYSEPVIAYWGDLISEVGQYPFAGGEGSEYDPYLISTPQQLAQLAYNVERGMDYNDQYFKLDDDIDIGGLYWNPIGASASEEFMGYFDGDNRVISNLTIGSSDLPSELEEAGLFGYLASAEIHNVIIENAAIYSSLPDYYGEIGVLAGEVNSTLINHCSVSGVLSSSSYSGSYVGGLVGKIDSNSEGIIACSADVDISVSSNYSGDVGGLVGEAYCPIIGSSAAGSVSGIGYLGGLVGNSTDEIVDCYATGAVSAASMGGGLVGYNEGTVLNCYATGDVYGYWCAGGLVGFHYYNDWVRNSYATGAVSVGFNGSYNYSGGLVGESCGSLQNSYAAGQATYGQGFLDYLFEGTVTDGFWNSDLNDFGGAGTGKTTAQMQSADFAALLNSESAVGRDDTWREWKIVDGVNNGMPVLDGVGIGMDDVPPVITSANGTHNLAAEAEISFESSDLGQYYYAIVSPGGAIPDMDTEGSGALCYAGANSYTIPVTSGAWDIYITVKDLTGIVSEPVKIELAEEPALFAGGSGTVLDPYQVAAPYHLHNVRYFPNDHFIMTEDIDLDPALLSGAFWYDSEKGWLPIGADDLIRDASVFNGTFDGNGKTVSNMCIGSAETPDTSLYRLGLFGYVNTAAVIRDLGVTSFSIYSNCYSVGAGGLASALYGTVDHCYASGSIYLAFNGTAGGLVAGNYTTTITNSWADVDLSLQGGGYSGGLVGFNNGYIGNCGATGNIQGGTNPYAGGLVGYNMSYDSNPNIENCYATGDISGSGWGYVGAICADNYLSTAFSNCYRNADAAITVTSDGFSTPSITEITAGCQSMYSADMKSSSFVDTLNAGLPGVTGYSEWEIVSGLNDGYPIPSNEPAGDLTAPTVSDSEISTSNVTPSGVTLAWEEASDNVTDVQDLLYRLYRSSSNNINTVAAIEANGTPVTGFASMDMYTVGSLTASTTYYFNIIVKDEAGNKSAYQTKSVTTSAAIGGGGGSSYYSIISTSNEGGTITPSGTTTAVEFSSKNFTITPNEGYIISDVLIDGESIGAVKQYTFSSITSNHTIEAKFEHDCPSKAYTDVDTSLWYHEGIDYVLLAGLFNGTSATTFEPNADMTRAMLVTVLWRLDGEPNTAATNLFSDVSAGTWYTDAVIWAAENDIVKGYDADTFGPNDPITREQLAAILYRYASYKGYDVSASDSLETFTDLKSVSNWALTSVKWAVAEGLITGMSETTLDPVGNASRAQVATILMRFVGGI